MPESLVESLYQALLSFAKDRLARDGEFPPFGAALDREGRMVSPAIRYSGPIPQPEELVKLLNDGFRSQAEAGEIQVCGVCMDVLILPPGEDERRDAICLEMEDEGGEAVDIYVPYRKSPSGEVQYDEAFATPRAPEIFIPRETVH
jgi:hypothetical protein